MAIVTGIFPSCDPTAIQAALTTAGVDASKVKVVTKSEPSEDHEESIMDFIYVAQAQESNSFSDDMTHGTNLVADSGGTTVPGMHARLQDLRAFGTHGTVYNYLGTTDIPTDVAGNYNDAVDEGRCVAIYAMADGDSGEAIATSFRNAGFKNVRTF
ncbi:MAG: hypothetical protein M3R30_07715 [Candidatus Eremiobacteraeota bacterium]|nr:hypothetical protein [Candidatus Eremiobacteraeota bacterium]